MATKLMVGNLHFKQQKTKLYHVHPITTQAKELLGDRFDSMVIFRHLKYSSKTSIDLCQWAIAAGVAKMTFHSARHTHVSLLLSHGVDIYTGSKLLGHRHVVSTERYAHVIDKLKTEAINKLAGIHSKRCRLLRLKKVAISI